MIFSKKSIQNVIHTDDYQALTYRYFQLPEAAVKQSILHNLTDLIIPPNLRHRAIAGVRT